ncbi:DUF1348 family protein [Paraglaciecola sp.]|uniref:DUF1348 family protein n=1 Tax=Paraglaciecola sp. TaxID=1920173 RepID=UPI0030F4B2F2
MSHKKSTNAPICKITTRFTLVALSSSTFFFCVHNVMGDWFRSYGKENWEFDSHGYMTSRIASIND